MKCETKELIDKLKLELDVLEKDGYAPSVREPRRMQRVFRDSVSCPNLGTETKVDPCSSCYLIEFVPPEHRDKEDACHYIPLNERGDTATALLREGGEEALHTALHSWLEKTIGRLELESLVSGKTQRVLLTAGEQRPCLLLSSGRLTSTS